MNKETVFEDYKKLKQKAKKVSDKNPVCALCGKALNEDNRTREHLPPKLLITDRADEFITVPSCYQCNNGTSDSDVHFRNLLALWLYNQLNHTEEARTIFHKWSEYFGKNKGYQKLLVSCYVDGKGINKNKIWTKTQKHHDIVVRKMILGLYWLYHEGLVVNGGWNRIAYFRRFSF